MEILKKFWKILSTHTLKIIENYSTLDSERERLETIEGIVPSITEFQFNNCRFANRCEKIRYL